MRTIFAGCMCTVVQAMVLCCALSVGMVRAQTNLVINGSFEAGPAGQNQFTGWSWLGPASNDSDYGVAQAGGGNEQAEQGSYFAYFRGHPTDSSQDCLGTTLAVKIGGIYTISYWMATDGPLTNGAAMWAQVSTNFGLSPNSVTLPPFFPYSATALAYRKFSTNWMATNTWMILSFHGINATNGVPVTNGILLDNVSVLPAYPPLTMNYLKPASLIFSWPFTNSPYRLQSCTSLSAMNWSTLTNVPVNIGTNSQITLTMTATNSALFYRLTLP